MYITILHNDMPLTVGKSFLQVTMLSVSSALTNVNHWISKIAFTLSDINQQVR